MLSEHEVVDLSKSVGLALNVPAADVEAAVRAWVPLTHIPGRDYGRMSNCGLSMPFALHPDAEKDEPFSGKSATCPECRRIAVEYIRDEIAELEDHIQKFGEAR